MHIWQQRVYMAMFITGDSYVCGRPICMLTGVAVNDYVHFVHVGATTHNAMLHTYQLSLNSFQESTSHMVPVALDRYSQDLGWPFHPTSLCKCQDSVE